MDVFIGIVGSALLSWLVTRHYYYKSLREQANEAQSEISRLLSLIEKQNELNETTLNQQHLEKAVEEYKRVGTPVRVIDTYDGMTKEQKADLYDAVMLRVKGRKGKSNKYRL